MTFPIDTTAHDEAYLQPPSDYLDDAAADRARGLAALHALVDWFAAHPEVPLPDSVRLSTFLHAGPGATMEQRLDRIDAFARAHGGERLQTNDTVWAQTRLSDRTSLLASYTLMTKVGPPR